MNRNFRIIASSLLASSALVGAAHADFVDVYCSGTGAGQSVSVTLNGNGHNSFAGQIALTLSNSTGVNLNGNWVSYCTELDQHISPGGATNTYEVLPVSDLPIPGLGMGTARADAIARMYKFANGAQYGASNDYAAAFQVAIWEISNDYTGSAGSLDIGAGIFTGNLSAGILSDLSTLLAAAANTNGALADITGLGNGSYQDQIIETPGNIPAPGALALLGAAGLFGARRRRA